MLMIFRVDAGEYPLAHDRKMIADTLGKEWTVTVAGDAIEIKSTFMVYWISLGDRVGPPAPVFNDATSQTALEQETKPEPYVIRLEYGQRLEPGEIRRRFAERQKFAETLVFGSASKDAWHKAEEGFSKIRVPRYDGWTCSIYRIVPDSGNVGGVRLYPPRAVAKIGAAKELLDAVMGRRNLYAYE